MAFQPIEFSFTEVEKNGELSACVTARDTGSNKTITRVVTLSTGDRFAFVEEAAKDFGYDAEVAKQASVDFVREICDVHPEPQSTDYLKDLWNHPEQLGSSDDAPAKSSITPALTRACDVVTKEIEWLWRQKLALGKLNLIAGEPGSNKSCLTIDIASRVSTGTPWPDGSDCPHGRAILLNAEDAADDTIVPRLIAAGADLKNVVILEGANVPNADGGTRLKGFTLDQIALLEDALGVVKDCKLVVIDPVSAYLSDSDSHKNAEIRGLLAPVGALAAKYGVCVLMVTHLNKSVGGKAMHRSMGSLAFVAAARSAWLVSKDPENNRRRYFVPIKNNLGNDVDGYAFTVENAPGDIPCLAWEREIVRKTADEILSASAETHDAADDRAQTVVDDAAEWLVNLLSKSGGEMLGGEIGDKGKGTGEVSVRLEVKAAGLSWASVKRAKQKLRIKSRKRVFDGKWVWKLPPGFQVENACGSTAPVSQNVEPHEPHEPHEPQAVIDKKMVVKAPSEDECEAENHVAHVVVTRAPHDHESGVVS